MSLFIVLIQIAVREPFKKKAVLSFTVVVPVTCGLSMNDHE